MMVSQQFSRILCSGVLLFSAHTGYAHTNHEYTNATNYQVSKSWTNLATGQQFIGKSHGEIDVAQDGKFYLSLMSTPESKGGIHIYSAAGERVGEVPNAPDDFHGFVIHQDSNGKEYIYGASLRNKKIIKMTLQGRVVLDVDAVKAIPSQYHSAGKQKLKLTAIDVDGFGDLYVVDGYSLDYIHKFDAKGNYLSTFGGQDSPYKFDNCHKIHIDPRFEPNRLICTDRKNGRLVHMSLDGGLIGTYARDLRRPSAVAFYHDLAAVAEISGRVSLLDKSGKTISTLGTNEVAEEINTNVTTPNMWRNGIFTAPHGITFDNQGNLFVTEWNKWGRIVRFDLTSPERTTKP
ncbi:hypothetical protein RS130_00395 [Paraglaciecola aquimarina]|uniref:6-bladed beta-propeller n=1 Tax=Paraglaciecola aquimarina TaxID=1235557 RepID=A0ABU3SRC7_9ALTE|nr:hypothetical protein [Paraglaciecola aquimarina]MDU0352571.1 hypothetical protein [Paraglaciecola aquimarina]